VASMSETEPRTVAHLTVAERIARGKAARSETPRSSHAGFEPAPGRPDPVDLLEEQAQTRLPELVPIRYGRMLVSPFTFYRGGAKIMARDLAATPRSGFTAQCCGDAHLSNFGLFASPERRLVFDLNDFDETLPGPWEWDVKRLAVSMLIAARDNNFTRKAQQQVVLDTVGQYRLALRNYAEMPNLAVWYDHLEAEPMLREVTRNLKRRQIQTSEKVLAKARTRDSTSALAKLTHLVDGEPRIVDESPLIVPLSAYLPPDEQEAVFAELERLLRVYRGSLEFSRRALLEQFRLTDFARKVVGVGSVGTRAWIGLLFGRDHTDPLFLQLKEAEASVLEAELGPSEFSNHGQRVVEGQRMMQATSDIFLGWVRVESPVDGETRDFYGRQLRDWKGSVEIERLLPPGMSFYGKLCGRTLARAHARSGDRVAIASYLGSGSTFDRALLEFSIAYADQNERDYRSLVAAVDCGRVEATSGL
jgi:uncharacterized protein (DUF2252 family)